MNHSSPDVAKRPFFRRFDLLAVGLLVLGCLLWLLFSSVLSEKTTGQCEIYYDGNRIATVSLTEDQRFSVPEAPEVVFTVQKGAICFSFSDCPDQTCVHTGWLSAPGQYAICLPHRLMLLIPSEDSPSVDGITGANPSREVL